jgi:hypothetical protein
MLGKRCLEEGTLSNRKHGSFETELPIPFRFTRNMSALRMIWFFRIAGRILSEADKAIIVAEMGLAKADLRSCAARLSVLIRQSPLNLVL